MAHAEPSDVETYLQRPLDNEERVAAQAYLDIIEILLTRKVTNFDDRLAEANFSKAVRFVEGSIVADVLRNPDRLTYEQAGDYSYSLGAAVGATDLMDAITDTMWLLLGVNRRGAFTIDATPWSSGYLKDPRWWTPTSRY